MLSYYRDTSNLYFPHGQIDLRYGISASISDRDKTGVHFTVETDHRTYYFRADSAQSAKDWVKCLQRVIFRSHNDGDSVKISLPIRNVIDIEETQMLEFAETCKIRVIDNDETYAIDEVMSLVSFENRGDRQLTLSSTSSHSLASVKKPLAFSRFSSTMQSRTALRRPKELTFNQLWTRLQRQPFRPRRGAHSTVAGTAG